MTSGTTQQTKQHEHTPVSESMCGRSGWKVKQDLLFI